MSAKLKNAPVYFTLGQIQHNPLLSLESYVPAIQESMRKAGYPGFKRSLRVAFNLNQALVKSEGAPSEQLPTERVEIFEFTNIGDTSGFVMTANALSFQTTDYHHFEAFSAELKKGLEVLSSAVGGLSFVERLGLRYLDAVVPRSGESLSDYLVPHLLGLPTCMPEAQFGYSFSESLLVSEGVGKVISRTVIQNGAINFPPDLQPLGLKLLDRFRSLQGEHAILDTDSSLTERRPFEINEIEDRMDKLHNLASSCFKASVMPHALTVWNAEGEG